jgi:hypothetical protein
VHAGLTSQQICLDQTKEMSSLASSRALLARVLFATASGLYYSTGIARKYTKPTGTSHL